MTTNRGAKLKQPSKALRVCLVKSLWNNKIIYLRIRYDKSLFPSPIHVQTIAKTKNSKTKGASESCARILRAKSTTENLEKRSHGEGKFQFPRFQSERRDRFPIASSLSHLPMDAHVLRAVCWLGGIKLLSCPINWNIKKIYGSFLMPFIVWYI